jgi:hypothetical protein
MPNRTKDYDLFLSHASEDGAWCERLAKRLRADGVRVWLDTWELQPGDKLADRINDGIERSRQTAVVWTPRYFAPHKQWTKAEQWSRQYTDALGQNRLLIPLLREDCEIPALLTDLLLVDFRSDERFEDAVLELREALCLPEALRRASAREPVPESARESVPSDVIGHSIAASPLGPLLDPVLLVLAVVFLGMVAFGIYLVYKGQPILGVGCVVPSFLGSLSFLYVHGVRRNRGAAGSSMEFALYRNAAELLGDHARSAEQRPWTRSR